MKLLLLRCPVCSEPLKPADRDVVLACDTCLNPISIDNQGIKQTEVHYGVPTQPEMVSLWLPFWVFHGRVNIQSRTTQGRNKRAYQASQAMWSQPRYLFVPAWELPMHQTRHLGGRLIQGQPVWQEGERLSDTPFTAVNVPKKDAKKLLELTILTMEAERKDWLKEFWFTVEAPAPALWILPAQTGRGEKIELLAKVQS